MARNKGGTESISRKIAALNRAKSEIPALLASNSENYFKRNFRNQSFDGQRWTNRKNGKDKGRGLLVKTGHLRNSIHRTVVGWRLIRIESDLPYSAIHNYGLTGMAFGKHKFKMPQRKFMGDAKDLRKQNLNIINNGVKKVMSR
jgi:phage gpG-like protein